MFSFGLSDGGRVTFNDVFVAVELSFAFGTIFGAFARSRSPSSGSLRTFSVTIVALLSGELGTLGSLLAHVLVSELVLGVPVELTPADALFILELESELTTLFELKFATDAGKWSWVRTFWYAVGIVSALWTGVEL